MSDLLKQILAKMPAQTSSVSQLQQIFKAINNSNIQGYIDYKPNSGQQQLTLTLPLVTRSNATTAINIDIKLPQIDLSKLNLKQPLLVSATPKIDGNRVSFELSLRPTELAKATNTSMLSQFKFALSNWSNNSTPLVFIKEIPLNSTTSTKSQAVSSAVQTLLRNSLLQSISQSTTGNLNATAAKTSSNNVAGNNVSGENASKLLQLKVTLTDSLKQSVITESKGNTTDTANRVSNSRQLSLNEPAVFLKSKLSTQQLQVLRNSIVEGRFSPSPSSANQATALSQLISQFPLLKSIATQVSTGAAKNLTQLIQTTLQRIPDASSINSSSLKQMINDSGLFYEQKQSHLLNKEKINFEVFSKALNDVLSGSNRDKTLLNSLVSVLGNSHAQTSTSTASTHGDLKHLFSALRLLLIPLAHEGAASTSSNAQLNQSATLAQFLQRLIKPSDRKAMRNIELTKQQQRAISQLTQDIDSANSRIRQAQTSNLLHNDPTSLFVELPLFFKQQLTTVQLNLAYERTNKQSKQQKWNVTVRFDFPSLGAFHAIIKLHNDFLDVRFVAEKPHTQELLAGSMGELEARLRQSGLNVSALESSSGQSKTLSPNSEQVSGVNFVI